MNVTYFMVGGNYDCVAIIKVTHHLYHHNMLTWLTRTYKLGLNYSTGTRAPAYFARVSLTKKIV